MVAHMLRTPGLAVVVAALATGAIAQTPHLNVTQPPSKMEPLIPASNVVSTEHYQDWQNPICEGGICTAEFQPRRNQMITITRVSCGITSSSTIALQSANVVVLAHGGTIAVAYPSITYSNGVIFGAINQAVDLQITSPQRFQINIYYASSNGTHPTASCGVTGTVSTFG